ncbi:MAG TPA: hypothetical protein VFH27_11175, partial [Longimicrobiaceae bacterium]|nr:hypothetical protein [Longimicrobiaceae bacterium]
NYVKQLLDAIDSYLSSESAFDDFQRTFSRIYLEELPPDLLSETETELFSEIHERSEWVSASPTAEERSYGWRGPPEFSSWLSQQRARNRQSSSD